MADLEGSFVRLTGIDDLKRALQDVPKDIRTRFVKGALRKAAQKITREAKANAPVLGDSSRLAFGPVKRGRVKRQDTTNRIAGLLKKSIGYRASKFARQEGNEGVYIGVRRAKGASYRTVKAFGIRYRYMKRASQRGTRNDPFYWRFMEFGFRDRRGVFRKFPFLLPAAKSKGQEAIDAFMRESFLFVEKLDREGPKRR